MKALEIRRQTETSQTTASLRLARILRRVPATGRELLSASSERQSANTSVNDSKRNNNDDDDDDEKRRRERREGASRTTKRGYLYKT